MASRQSIMYGTPLMYGLRTAGNYFIDGDDLATSMATAGLETAGALAGGLGGQIVTGGELPGMAAGYAAGNLASNVLPQMGVGQQQMVVPVVDERIVVAQEPEIDPRAAALLERHLMINNPYMQEAIARQQLEQARRMQSDNMKREREMAQLQAMQMGF